MLYLFTQNILIQICINHFFTAIRIWLKLVRVSQLHKEVQKSFALPIGFHLITPIRLPTPIEYVCPPQSITFSPAIENVYPSQSNTSAYPIQIHLSSVHHNRLHLPTTFEYICPHCMNVESTGLPSPFEDRLVESNKYFIVIYYNSFFNVGSFTFLVIKINTDNSLIN